MARRKKHSSIVQTSVGVALTENWSVSLPRFAGKEVINPTLPGRKRSGIVRRRRRRPVGAALTDK
jgi:hypothetical protein